MGYSKNKIEDFWDMFYLFMLSLKKKINRVTGGKKRKDNNKARQSKVFLLRKVLHFCDFVSGLQLINFGLVYVRKLLNNSDLPKHYTEISP